MSFRLVTKPARLKDSPYFRQRGARGQGGRTVLGRIKKRGSRYLRMLFVQDAKVILKRPHRWPGFSFGEWLIRAEPRMHRNKLAIALANKLARTAWSVLHHGTTFDAPRDEVAVGV